jgi:hypothetical protein
VCSTFRPEIVPLHPRNPQQQSTTGQAKDEPAKGSTMRSIPSIRSLLFALVMLAISAAAFAQIGISVSIAPPALPVYEQPPVPAEGYLWTPGYWAYGNGDYYWVPGTWVMAPQPGFLWTPGYWDRGNGGYAFNEGYWGPHVGFYGGINYGYGYTGEGYQGGRWNNGQFEYNRSVNNVNVTNIHNTYNITVINNTTVNRVSYNGGTGGIAARPTARDETAAHEKHIPPVAAQTQHAQAARANQQRRASVNHGKPAIAATPKAGALDDRAAVPAKGAGAPYKPAVNKAAKNKASERKAAATRPTENKARENKAAATHSSENKAVANKTAATRTSENKAAADTAAATRTNENKAIANKTAATRTNENKARENKAATQKAAKPARPATQAQSSPLSLREKPLVTTSSAN